MADTLTGQFPASKFVVPHSRAGLLERRELVTALFEEVRQTTLTVVSAPAGYGKTVLVAALAAHTPLCWVSLDPDDNEPERFLAALTVALAGRTPAAVGPAALLADDPTPEPGRLRRIATAWLNAATHLEDDLVVVLDEWELITADQVRAQLAFLVEWAPPNLHLVLTTRGEPGLPLARLRTHAALAERGLPDLRFTTTETEALLNDVLGLDVPAAEAHRMHALTEGWPAGLRLLATSADPARVADIRAAGETHVFDYLAEEVFARQPESTRRFLVETAVLTELTAPACAALTGRADAADVLDDLARSGMFLLSPAGQAYRYHPLFSGFLRAQASRLAAGNRQDLHRRAAAAETDPLAVAGHLLAAGDESAAAELLATEGEALVRTGRAGSVRDLLAALPETALIEHPRLGVLSGELAYRAGDLATARTHLERVLGTGGPARGEILARLAECRLLQGEVAAGQNLVQQALAGPLPPPLRVRLLLSDAQLAEIQGMSARAETTLAEALKLAAGGDSATMEAAALHVSAAHCLIRGSAAHLEDFAVAARAALPDPGHPARLQLDGTMVTVALLRGDTHAIEDGRRVIDRFAPYGGAPPFLACSLGMLAVISAGAFGAPVPLDDLVDDLLRRAERLTNASYMYPNVWFVIGRARWQRGQVALAADARRRIVLPDGSAAGSAAVSLVNRLSLDAMLAQADGRTDEAEGLLREAIDREDRMPLVNIYGSARLRLAAVHAAQDRPDTAVATAAPALAEAERTRLGGRLLFEGPPAAPVFRLAAAHGPHRRYAADLLRRLEQTASARPIRVPATGELLTPRETEVLRLVSSGATNREIAERLVVGPETVKTHVTRLLRKLDVRTRTAAATRARELGLAPPETR